MEKTEDAAYSYWPFLKLTRIMHRLLEKELIDQEGCVDLVREIKEQWELSELLENLTDNDYVAYMEMQYGVDAASCPIPSIQAKWKARQAANIDPEYISFTEIVKRRKSELTPSYALQCWLREKKTIEYLCLWEQMQNPAFRHDEARRFMKELEDTNGTLTLKQWIARTGAIGIVTLPGRYGGTYADRMIADDFEMWLSPRYRYYAFQQNRYSFDKWLEEFEQRKDAEKKMYELE